MLKIILLEGGGSAIAIIVIVFLFGLFFDYLAKSKKAQEFLKGLIAVSILIGIIVGGYMILSHQWGGLIIYGVFALWFIYKIFIKKN